MNDLISRNAVLKIIKDEIKLKSSYVEHNAQIDILFKIKGMSSAYDIDKVVERINDMIVPTPEYKHKFCADVGPKHCAEYENCEDCVAERIIEIIKTGYRGMRK